MNRQIFSHLNENGKIKMVDVAEKRLTKRSAIAGCEILMDQGTFQHLRKGTGEKGDAFTAAKLAGIQAAKKTSDLIPLCHPIAIEHVEIRFLDRPQEDGFSLEVEVKMTAKTGAEMEALIAASVAALTLYDMVKGYNPGIVITNLHLIQKTGGKSGYFNQNRNLNRK